MRRASASPAACASASSATRSRAALVATTASVVLRPAPNGAPPRARYSRASANLPVAPRAPARIAPPARAETGSEDPGGRSARHGARRADGEATAPLAQPAHHAVRRAQPVSRAAGEQDGVDVPDEVARIEGIELARAGRASSERA